MRPPLASLALSFVGPALALFLGLHFLLKGAGVAMGKSGRCGTLLLLSLGIMALPVHDLCLARWVTGVVPGFSVPMLALLGHVTIRRFGGAGFFRADELRTVWAFGAGAGLALYPLALGLSAVDPYAAGWQFGALFVTMGVLAAGWIACGNRFGWVLVAAVLAWHLRLLESANYWDYLVDPIYALLALPFVVATLFRRSRPRRQPVDLR